MTSEWKGWLLSHNEILGQLSNLSMRAATLISRFSLLFLAARALPVEEFALFGLLSALVVFGQYVIGMDFYTYSARQIVWETSRARVGIFISHMFLIVLTYILAAACILLASDYLGISGPYIGALLPLLLFECWSQEVGRLLVSLGRPAAAGAVLFLRSGAWALALSVGFLVSAENITLMVVLQVWLGASACAAVLATLLVWRAVEMKAWHVLGFGWIWNGLLVAAPFWLSSILLRGIGFYDRVWFEALSGSYDLAAYVLYAGVAGALGSFLDAGVYSFLYPKLIARWNDGDLAGFQKVIFSMLVQVTGVSVFFVFSILIVLPFTLEWIGKPVYSENISILWVLLFANVLMALSMVPNYAMYAKGQDRLIFFCNLMSFVGFCFWVLVISCYSKLYAVPVGVACCFGIMAFMKWVSYLWGASYKGGFSRG